MPFEVPKSKASIKQNVFEFTIPGSKKVYSLPLMQYIGADLAADMSKIAPSVKEMADAGENDPEVVAALSEWQRSLFERYAPGIYKQLSTDQIGALAHEWREASTVGVGESQPPAEN